MVYTCKDYIFSVQVIFVVALTLCSSCHSRCQCFDRLPTSQPTPNLIVDAQTLIIIYLEESIGPPAGQKDEIQDTPAWRSTVDEPILRI